MADSAMSPMRARLILAAFQERLDAEAEASTLARERRASGRYLTDEEVVTIATRLSLAYVAFETAIRLSDRRVHGD